MQLEEVVLSKGYTLNKILPTMFALRKNGKIVGVMSSNVDDLLHGELPEAEEDMKNMIEEFAIRQQEEDSFRFCGKEVVQDAEYNITITAKNNTEKIRPVDIGVSEEKDG